LKKGESKLVKMENGRFKFFFCLRFGVHANENFKNFNENLFVLIATEVLKVCLIIRILEEYNISCSSVVIRRPVKVVRDELALNLCIEEYYKDLIFS
jgi:hypothetical protein